MGPILAARTINDIWWENLLGWILTARWITHSPTMPTGSHLQLKTPQATVRSLRIRHDELQSFQLWLMPDPMPSIPNSGGWHASPL